MTKRGFIVLLALVVVSGMALATGQQQRASEPGRGPVEIDFGRFSEAYPSVPARAPATSYAYDDMSQRHDFEILTYGYIVQPVQNNPISAFLSDEMNAGITFTDVPGPDLTQVVSVRFAAGNPPDLIHLTDKAAAVTLAQQAQLLNPYPYLDYVPQLGSYVTETLARWATYEGAWLGFPRYGTFPDNWGLFIRGDWLDQFGMSMPRTTDDLLEFARAVRTRDPNRTGRADTWFMGTAGGGRAHFQMMEQLRSAFGHPAINVVDGRVNHPMLDGTARAYLEFLRKLYVEDLLHPDWYTIEWEAFKSFTMNNQIGMVNYPGWNLIQEQYDAAGQSLDAARVWRGVPAISGSDGRGGRLMPGGAPGGLFVFPTRLEQNQGRLRRVMHFLDTLIYPNVHYWAASQGGDSNIYPGQSEVKFDPATGLNVFNLFRDTHPAYADPNLNPLWNWQTLGYTLIWQVYDDPMGQLGSEWNIFQVSQPRHTNYALLVTVDSEVQERLTEFTRREEIAFVLGERSFADWNTFVTEWLDRGGQRILDTAATQLSVQPHRR